jgi:putative transposase
LSRDHRIWFPGAKYHITNRGNRRAAFFYDDFDHQEYLNLLEESRKYFPFHLHAYCLMTNHIHLLIETIHHHPKDIMKMLNSRYAMYFNKRHHLVGHVFRGRYGAELIDTAEYLLGVSRYIHLNPLKQIWSRFPKITSGAATMHILQLPKTLTLLPLRYYPIFQNRRNNIIVILLKGHNLSHYKSKCSYLI